MLGLLEIHPGSLLELGSSRQPEWPKEYLVLIFLQWSSELENSML